MIVYRIQDKKGRGPWKPGFSDKWVRPIVDEALIPWYKEHPNFNPAYEVEPCEHLGVGCESKEQLRRWVTREEHEKLKSFGYRSVRMKVDRVFFIGDTQVLFARKRALRKNVQVFELYRDQSNANQARESEAVS